jgi:hypothetical protein
MLAENNQVSVVGGLSLESRPVFPEDVMGEAIFRRHQEDRVNRERRWARYKVSAPPSELV